MARRHWILLAVWGLLFATVLVGAVLPGSNKSVLGMPFLFSPIVAIVTLARVFRRTDIEPMLPRARIAQRVLAGACVVLAIGGIVGSASQIVETGGAPRLENGPIALFFLISLVAGYRALVRPTPRNTALPAVVVHCAWLPLLLLNKEYERLAIDEWQQALSGLGLLGLLGASALLAMLAIAAFAGEPSRVPEARKL